MSEDVSEDGDELVNDSCSGTVPTCSHSPPPSVSRCWISYDVIADPPSLVGLPT